MTSGLFVEVMNQHVKVTLDYSDGRVEVTRESISFFNESGDQVFSLDHSHFRDVVAVVEQFDGGE